MDETQIMHLLIGLAVGLLIALAAVIAMSGRATPVVVMQPPPPTRDPGCGGFLMAVVAIFMIATFFLIVMS